MSRKVRIGVFGANRGSAMIDYCMKMENAQLVAVCDRNEWLLEKVKKRCKDTSVIYYTDFDEFIKQDMDAVVLANYATEHAPFAIRCLKRGLHVYSEALPCQTMKEAVELIEAVEETEKIYAYGENYCYTPAAKEMRKLFMENQLGEFEYGEGEYMYNREEEWHSLTYGDPNHWRNNMYAHYDCTHSIGPMIHISRMRPISVVGFEMPFNERMKKMGAKAGHTAMEIITLENGAVIKSIHGVGCSCNSVWFSAYGSEGRVESAREDTSAGGVEKVYLYLTRDNPYKRPTDYMPKDKDAFTAQFFGHQGSDFYAMYNFIEKVKGNPEAEIIDIYEAMDMFLPGMLGYRSVLKGNVSVPVPNFRNREEREMYRNETACTDPKVAGDMLIPSYSKGNPDISDAVYQYWKGRYEEERNHRNQLMLIFFPKEQFPIGLPEGFEITKYKGTIEEQDEWVEICKNGLLSPDDTRKAFRRRILEWWGVDPFEDVFFIEHEGKKVATITAADRVWDGFGYIHMVAVRPEYRGLGLGNCLNRIAMNKLAKHKCKIGYLTTSENRKPACKSYLRAGCYPVNTGEDMPGRWAKLIGELGIDSVQMVTETGEPDRIIYAESSIKS